MAVQKGQQHGCDTVRTSQAIKAEIKPNVLPLPVSGVTIAYVSDQMTGKARCWMAVRVSDEQSGRTLGEQDMANHIGPWLPQVFMG
jgi:hypothetical protein